MSRVSLYIGLVIAPVLGSPACGGSGSDAVSGGPPGTTTSTSGPTTPTSAATPTTGAETTLATTTDTTTPAGTTSTTGPAATTMEAATSTGLADASTSGGPAGTCGNGVIDPGETCDPGLAQLSDAGACTLSCEVATCGDGKLWEGEEKCDEGPNNNDKIYGGCATDCQFGPRCGDGYQQAPPEECDVGGALRNGVVCTGCRYEARVVFLSSASYTPSELGGLAGADLRCQQLAAAAGVDNAPGFMAWLSSGQASPVSRFVHGPETKGLPYVLRNGLIVAEDFDDLVKNGASEGITLTETGETVLDVRVWTNTDKFGQIFDPDNDCDGWTSDSFLLKTRVGRSGVDKAKFLDWGTWHDYRQWTSYVSFGCYEAQRLYCFEQ